MSMMSPNGDDFLAEVAALHSLVAGPHCRDSLAVTPFYGWRVRDVISHLATIDEIALWALTDEPIFGTARADFAAGTAARDTDSADNTVFHRIAAYERTLHDHIGWQDLVAKWQEGAEDLAAAARVLEPSAKCPWFGSAMRISTLLAARQMEVWAYGQDVFDSCRVLRPESDRLFNVADFANRVFSFSFLNRGLPVPASRPSLMLTAPSGKLWTWNEASDTERIEGTAVDFCRVATQRRNPADTGLVAVGSVASQWLDVAQCITGPPVDAPARGERTDVPAADAFFEKPSPLRTAS